MHLDLCRRPGASMFGMRESADSIDAPASRVHRAGSVEWTTRRIVAAIAGVVPPVASTVVNGLVTVAVTAATLSAQSPTRTSTTSPASPASPASPVATRIGPREILPRDVEIALARSAAPAGVSAQARVLALTDSGYVVAEPGSNGVTCLVDRSWSLSIEPHCYDAEGAASILPMFARRTELSHRGVSAEEIDREIADGLASGRFRLPRRPALTYMMSSAQVLYDDDGRFVGAWRPHLMLYSPYMTNAEVGLPATPDMSVGSVFDEGTPRASLVIMMPEFVSAPPVAARPPDR